MRTSLDSNIGGGKEFRAIRYHQGTLFLLLSGVYYFAKDMVLGAGRTGAVGAWENEKLIFMEKIYKKKYNAVDWNLPYVQEVVTRTKILNRLFLSNGVHLT